MTDSTIDLTERQKLLCVDLVKAFVNGDIQLASSVTTQMDIDEMVVIGLALETIEVALTACRKRIMRKRIESVENEEVASDEPCCDHHELI
jgi:hypothetical protein